MMEREDIRDMVNSMMSDALKPVLRDVSEVRARIIGIDGNGTGRMGALQRQDVKLQELADGHEKLTKTVDTISDNVSTILLRSSSWTLSKASFYASMKWFLPTLITLLALILSYMGYRASQHLPPLFSGHSSNATSAPTTDAINH